MRFPLESTSRKSQLTRAIKPVLESLETRQMLAIVNGGEIGYYQNGAGQVVKVAVDGGGSLVFVGSSRDGNGNAQLNDIPMTILDASGNFVRNNLGGVAGRDGLAPIHEIVQNPNKPELSLMTSIVGDYYTRGGPADGIAFEALGTNTLGRTYAINRRTEAGAADDDPAYDVVGVDNDIGRVEVLDSIAGKMLAALQAANPEFKREDLGDLIGADFDLVNPDILYFAIEAQFPFRNGADFERKDVPILMTYNIRSETVNYVNNFGAGRNDTYTIDDFTVLSATKIAFFGSLKDGDNDAEVGLFISDKDAPGADNPLEIALPATGGGDPQPFTTIAALEAINENFILAVDARSESGQLIRIDLADRGTQKRLVAVTAAGATVDADVPEDDTEKRGADIADLSYNSRLVDNAGFQFGNRGVLLGADTTTDELVGLDMRQRFASTDVYAVYSAEATTDTSLSMTILVPDTDEDLSFEDQLFQGIPNPYASNAGALGTFMTDPGQDAPVSIPLNNGGVFIGGREFDADDRPILPVMSLSSDRSEDGDYVGSLPGMKLPATVTPGIYIDGSIQNVFIAGTITGRVSIEGSVDMFYAGNVVTGNALNGTGSITVDNFFVGGDMRNLFVAGGIGTLAGAPGQFAPQTDFAIGGRVMQIKAGLSFKGSLDVVGKTNNNSIRTIVSELETVIRDQGNSVALAFNDLLIANQGFNSNDSFDNPQIVGSISDNRGRGGSVTIVGNIDSRANISDFNDYYGIPLLAGEGALIQMPIGPRLEILDPSGRIYYTDNSNQNETGFNGQAINVTADKPGLWRVRAFNPANVLGAIPYILVFNNLGALSLGGLNSNGNINLSRTDLGVKVRTGDLGSILAGGTLFGGDAVDLSGREAIPVNPITTQAGSIRSFEAANIGRIDNADVVERPNIVSSKKIGLIHSDGVLYINDPFFTLIGTSADGRTAGKPSRNFVTGGDIQTVEAGGEFNGVLATNGSIGVIRAGSIDANQVRVDFASYIQINADNRGNDELGLIDCVGAFGNFSDGGAALSSGNGANIRYIRVGGAMFRDRFFGFGGAFVETATNDSITVTDDTGAEVSVKPITGTFTRDTTTGGTGTDTTGTGTDTLTGGLPDPFGGAGNSSSTGSSSFPNPFGGGGTGGLGGLPDPFGGTPVITDPTDPDAGVPIDSEVLGQIRLSTYPVRSGGFVITDVQSTTGITVATNREGGGGVADISRIQTGVAGTPLVEDEDGNLVADTGTTLDVILVGNSRINVFVLTGSQTGATGATYSRVDNFTDGEIVNINAQSIAVLAAEWLGVARPAAGAKIEGVNNVNDGRFPGVATLYPYNNAKNMIFVTNAGTIGARGPLGNITIKERVQNLVANAGNKNVKGVLEGIVAPILVLTGDDATVGIIDRIDIGEGLVSSGSGEISLGGIYSTDELGTISNVNGGGDLRGDVEARNFLNRINITGGGSIIDSDIYVSDVGADGRAPLLGGDPDNPHFGFEATLEVVNVLPVISDIIDSPANPIGVGKITITGTGGMMNARVFGFNIGKVTANGGSFGVLTSDFISETGGSMGGISADGLGIRSVNYRGGSFTGDIIATGLGKLRSIDEFSRSVRASESGLFDASTGVTLNIYNDLNLFLGTDKTIRSIPGMTNDGYIEDSLIEANRQIRSVKGFVIRARLNPTDARPRDETYPMQINTGGELKLVTTSRSIEGLRIVSGTTGTIQSGYDIKNFQLQTTGFVNTVSAKRNILGSSNLNLIGSASINQILVGGNMNGTAYVAKGIRSLVVGGNLASQKSQGGIYTAASINLVNIGGDVTSGTYLQAKNVIKSLVVDGDIQAGAEVLAKSISKKSIKGDVEGVVS